MNKIYRLIFSKTRNCLIVISELGTGNGKSKTQLNSVRAEQDISPPINSICFKNISLTRFSALILSLTCITSLVAHSNDAAASCSNSGDIVTCIDTTASYSNPSAIIGFNNYGSINQVNITSNIGDIASDTYEDVGILNKNVYAQPTAMGIFSLSNSATITGASHGIENWMPINTFNNSGIIQGNRGSAIFNSAYIENIINLGTIEGETGGINTQDSIGSILNSGIIHVRSGLSGRSYGISVSDIDATIGLLFNQSLGRIEGGNFGVSTIGAIGSLINSGAITGGAYGVANSGSITSLNNSGFINGTIGSGILNNAFVENLLHPNVGSIGTLTNSGTITGYTAVKNSFDTAYISGSSLAVNISNLQNTGLIQGARTAILNGVEVGGSYSTSTQLYASINSITNTGNISGGQYGLANNIGAISGSRVGKRMLVATIDSLSNGGSISGNSYGIYNTGTISNLKNQNGGVISGATASIYNSGTLNSISNAQGGPANAVLTYSGVLPTNYIINITNTSSYGQLKLLSGTGTTVFSIDPASTLSAYSYRSVLSGVASSKIANYSSIYNTWNVFNSTYKWELTAGTNSSTWDLVVAQIAPPVPSPPAPVPPIPSVSASMISSSPIPYASAQLPSPVRPIFDGGILQISFAGPISYDFAARSNGGFIDQNGVHSTFTGKICVDLCESGPFVFTNSKPDSGGSVTLANINAYTGSTTIDLSASLALSGAGTIANSSKVMNNGALDISAITDNSTSIKSLAGNGTVALGSKTLVINNAADNFAGSINGSGALNIASGLQTLSGSNNFSGGIQVQSGASLTVSSGSALGSGLVSLLGSTTVPASLIFSGSGYVSNRIVVQGDPILNIPTGSIVSIAAPISDGNISGDIFFTGGGTLNLLSSNTYTGPTHIDSGSTLVLPGSGSISQSSSVINHGTVNVSSNSGDVNFGGNYTQSASGRLVMGFSPSGNQQIKVGGLTALGGSLELLASGGNYSAGKYTLLGAKQVTGTFSNFSTNLSSYTRLGYSLGYGENDVYLTLTPNIADTQQSIAYSASALQNAFTLQNSALVNSLAYDCNEFGQNDICISAGGRNTAVSGAGGVNNSSGLIIAGYRPKINFRLGAYADQNISANRLGNVVSLGNSNPLIGVFGAWNEAVDGSGLELKFSAAYGQKDATVTRQVVNTSEAGMGSSKLTTQGAQITIRHGWALSPQLVIAPYVGVRYSQNNMGGYVENSTSVVTAPLTYDALNTNATTILAGVGASYKLTQQSGISASVGLESDTKTTNGSYIASGISGLSPINFNPNPVRTRSTASLGAYYEPASNQRISVTGIYRQEPFQNISTTSVMMTYTVGF